MRLDSIEAQNFLSHKHTALDFRSMPRVQIAGTNGSGKTSISVDAPLWALFGNARGSTTDNLLGPWDTSMEVSVEFNVAGKDYRVTRRRGSSSDLRLKNLTDDLDLSEKHVRLTEERIEALVGNENSFVNTAVFKQGDALRFAVMRPAERKALIDDLVGIQEYAEIETKARKAARGAADEVHRITREVNRINEAKLESETLRHEVDGVAHDLKEARQKLIDAQVGVDDAAKRLTLAMSGYDAIRSNEADLRDAQAELARVEGDHQMHTYKLGMVIKELVALKTAKVCPTCGQPLKTDSAEHKQHVIELEERKLLVQHDLRGIESRRITKQEQVATATRLIGHASTAVKDAYEEAQRVAKFEHDNEATVRIEVSRLDRLHSEKAGQLSVLDRELHLLPDLEQQAHDAGQREMGYGIIAEAFSKRGIPRELTRGFVSEIERAANALLIGLSPMTIRMSLERDGKTVGGVTEGTVDVWVKDLASERKVEMLSGGEKMRIMLALRLATAQAVAKKSDRACKTLICDESLDGLDPEGKDTAMAMLTSLTKSFDRMLFITHDPSIAGLFPDRFELIKTSDGSSEIVS